MQNNMITKLTAVIAIAMAMSTVGCGSGFQAGGAGNGGQDLGAKTSTPVSVEEEMAKAEQASVDAQDAIAEAQALIKQITDDKGNINLNLFKKSAKSETATAASPIPGLTEKLRTVFDKVFGKVTDVRTKFNDARKNLADALAKLDRNDPVQAEMINKILGELAKVDVMEQQFLSQIKSLASKLDLAITGLDKLVGGITNFIPGFGWVAKYLLDWLVIDDVKMLIMELKYRLMNL